MKTLIAAAAAAAILTATGFAAQAPDPRSRHAAERFRARFARRVRLRPRSDDERKRLGERHHRRFRLCAGTHHHGRRPSTATPM